MSRTLIQPQFPLYPNSTEYLKKTNRVAPWDPKKPLKTWEDPAGTGTYFTLSFGVSGVELVGFPFNSDDSKVVNLPPPHVEYPHYTVPETDATDLSTGIEVKDRSSNIYFSTKAEADALAAELVAAGISSALTAVDKTGAFSFIPGKDGRLVWVLQGTTAGAPLSAVVGMALLTKNQYGIGRPGKWAPRAVGAFTDLTWIPDDMAPIEITSSAPIPYPPLPAGAHLEAATLSHDAASVYVVTDDGGQVAGGGGFTDADRSILQAAYVLVKRIAIEGERLPNVN